MGWTKTDLENKGADISDPSFVMSLSKNQSCLTPLILSAHILTKHHWLKKHTIFFTSRRRLHETEAFVDRYSIHRGPNGVCTIR